MRLYAEIIGLCKIQNFLLAGKLIFIYKRSVAILRISRKLLKQNRQINENGI